MPLLVARGKPVPADRHCIFDVCARVIGQEFAFAWQRKCFSDWHTLLVRLIAIPKRFSEKDTVVDQRTSGPAPQPEDTAFFRAGHNRLVRTSKEFQPASGHHLMSKPVNEDGETEYS